MHYRSDRQRTDSTDRADLTGLTDAYGRRHAHDPAQPGQDHDPHEHERHEHGPFRGRGRHGGPFGPFGPDARGERGERGRGGPDSRSGRGGRGGRAQRGDVRSATLILLGEQPMHGYQLMQAMAERTGGAWRPSPGAIYPTINQLEDEGFVTIAVDGGRKLVTLTDTGRALVESGELVDPFAGLTSRGDDTDLRGVLEELHSAARQVARSGRQAQLQQAHKVLTDARRSLYLVLAEAPAEPTES